MFRLRLLITVSFFLLLAALPLRAKDDWLPITPADLNYKDPAGSAAVILYREDVSGAPLDVGGGRIDQNSVFSRSIYERIKVLTDEGKKYADIEIPYTKNFTRIEDLKARVVQPDGAVTEFNGQVYDKTVVKDRSTREQELAFTLPNVKPGSILEYRYTIRWNRYLLDTSWDLQRELWIKKAHFSIRPYTGYANVDLRLSWVGVNLPPGMQPTNQGGLWSMDATDIPPVPSEGFAPPEEWSHMTLRFLYSSDPDVALGQDAYWQKKAKWWGDWVEKFISKHKEVEAEAAKLIAPGDTPEAKLRKLYARAQQIRNLSFERTKTEKERKQEGLKDPENADDVLKQGYATARRIDQLFVALARAAGFDATYGVIASRNRHVFFKSILSTDQFNDSAAVIKLNGESLFLDPGTLYLPYGMLYWADTDAPALTATKNGGEFLTTPAPRAQDAIVQRTAALRVANGSLEGTVKMTFRGNDAVRWRLDERNNDETGRRKDLEDALRRLLPSGSAVDVTTVGNWTVSEEPLAVEYKVSIPNAITQTGKRLLVPAGIFQSNDVHPFRYASRRLPVYFSSPFRNDDEVTIELPPGYELEGTPQPRALTTSYAAYRRQASFADNQVHLERRLQVDKYVFMPEEYVSIRSFYDVVRAGDEETLVLKATSQ